MLWFRVRLCCELQQVRVDHCGEQVIINSVSLWLFELAAGSDISYQQGSWCEGERRETKTTKQKKWTVYVWKIVGREHKEMKTSESWHRRRKIILCAHPKTRGVSLYISVPYLGSFSASPSLSLSVCLWSPGSLGLSLSLLTHSPSPFSSTMR